jgi:C4-dicarboxylate-specific signal transduction histidine kinase
MSRFVRLPIRIQLILLAILLALPALGIIVYSGLQKRGEDYNKAAIESQKLADNLAAAQENFVHEAMELGDLIADLPDVKNHNISRTQAILANIQKKNHQYLNILLADADGAVWASALASSTGQSVADRLYFKRTKESLRFSSGEFVMSRSARKPSIHVAYPLLDHGVFTGAVILAFDLDVLRSVLERSQLPAGTNYILVDHSGIIISRGADSGRNVGEQIQASDFRKMLEGPDRATYEFTRADGDRRITTYRKLRIPGEKEPFLYVRAGMSAKGAVARANQQLVRNVVLLLPFVIVAFILAVSIGKRSIVNRIMLLQTASRRLADGHLDVRVAHLVEGGELGCLGSAFDDMAQRLSEKIDALNRAQLDLHEKTVMLEDEIAERQATQETLAVNQHELEALNRNLEDRIDRAVKDLRAKDQALIQQSRLAAMGEMINNIAHQWRQPLNLIGLIVQGMPQITSLSQAQFEHEVERIMTVIMHMSQTIDDFRNFFRQDKEKALFRVAASVEKAVEFSRPGLESKHIAIDVSGDREVTADGYVNEYAQVMLNLISNARDVLMERKIEKPYIHITISHSNGNSLVTLSDNGGGIDAEIMPKIFDPYFTTKDKSQGTGIGLYMSKMIIEQNMGGSLTARNTDRGAEFIVEI